MQSPSGIHADRTAHIPFLLKLHHACVYVTQDDGSYPVPPDSAVTNSFDLNEFTGKWYISAGLNPLFDIFDCQVCGCILPTSMSYVGVYGRAFACVYMYA